GPDRACGFLAVAGLLVETARRGLTARRVAVGNSGDTAGPRGRVGGYGPWALEGRPRQQVPPDRRQGRGGRRRRARAGTATQRLADDSAKGTANRLQGQSIFSTSIGSPNGISCPARSST